MLDFPICDCRGNRCYIRKKKEKKEVFVSSNDRNATAASGSSWGLWICGYVYMLRRFAGVQQLHYKNQEKKNFLCSGSFNIRPQFRLGVNGPYDYLK